MSFAPGWRGWRLVQTVGEHVMALVPSTTGLQSALWVAVGVQICLCGHAGGQLGISFWPTRASPSVTLSELLGSCLVTRRMWSPLLRGLSFGPLVTLGTWYPAWQHRPLRSLV